MRGPLPVPHRRRHPVRRHPVQVLLTLLALLALVCAGALSSQTPAVTVPVVAAPAGTASVVPAPGSEGPHGDGLGVTAPGGEGPDGGSPVGRTSLAAPDGEPGSGAAATPDPGDAPDPGTAPGPGAGSSPGAAPDPGTAPDATPDHPGSATPDTSGDAVHQDPYDTTFEVVRGQAPPLARTAGDERPHPPHLHPVLTSPRPAPPFPGAPGPGPTGDRLVDRDGHPGPRPGRAPPASTGI